MNTDDNLTVLIASIEYILSMKMVSTREQNLKDIEAIIKQKHFHSPFNTFAGLKKMGFDNGDFFVLLEKFS